MHRIVRGVFSPEDARVIRSSAMEAYRKIFRQLEPRTSYNTLHFHDLARRRPWMRQFAEWVIYRFTDSEAFSFYRSLFGERLSFPLMMCIFRYQAAGYSGAVQPFHQDTHQPFHHTDGEVRICDMLNCWIAFDDCGVDAPGLELVAEQPDRAVSVAGEYRNTVTPVFKAGEGCVFDQFTIHRTHHTPQMTKPRLSVEIRAARTSELDSVHGLVDRIEVHGAKRRTFLVHPGGSIARRIARRAWREIKAIRP